MADRGSRRAVRSQQRDAFDPPAPPSAELRQTLAQAQLLRTPRVRAIWRRLGERQQRYLFDPTTHPKVARRYPLSSGDVAILTGLSDRRVRYWADQGLIPHTRSESGRRRFETVGLLLALGLAQARQNEVHFYRQIAQEPAEAVTEKLDVLANILAARVEQADPAERQKLASSAEVLARALGLTEAEPEFIPLHSGRAESRPTATGERRHVLREGNAWVVKKPGERPSSHHATQREAYERAASILRNAGGGERITHRRDGRIRITHTIAPTHAPHPPRQRAGAMSAERDSPSPGERARLAPHYAGLKAAVERGEIDVIDLGARLSDGWTASYTAATPGEVELVEVDEGQLTYLFDIFRARLVGVYGRSAAPTTEYPRARMRGFPLPQSETRLVRGHLAAHTVGGGTDINLLPQSAALNISAAWRRMERWAEARRGSFLAVEVLYEDDSQTPARFVYVVAAERELLYEEFENR